MNIGSTINMRLCALYYLRTTSYLLKTKAKSEPRPEGSPPRMFKNVYVIVFF